MTEHTWQGALSQANTWQSQRGIEKVINGAIKAAETWQALRNIERVISGTLSPVMTWQMYFEGKVLNFLHTGALAQEAFLLSPKMAEYLWQGILNTTKTWQHFRNIERVIVGSGLRTNHLLYSEQLDQWDTTYSSVSPNVVVAPDDNTTADKIVEDSSNNQHYVVRSCSISQGVLYTASVYAKAGERTWIRLALGDNWAWFNLSSGAVGTIWDVTAAYITKNEVSGWCRCSMAVLTGNEAGWDNVYVFPATGNEVYAYQGDGVSGVYVWGAQLEEGETASNYIPTTSVAVTVQDSSAAILWKGDRTVERIIEGGAQEETWKSVVTRERIILSELMQIKTWQTGIYATNFRWIGTLFQTKSWGSKVIVDYKWLGKLAQTKTWGSAYWKAHEMLHQGAINAAKTWASTKNREHLVVGNLTMERWLRLFPPFSEAWDKDSATVTGWTNQSGIGSTWTKNSPTSAVWTKTSPTDDTWMKQSKVPESWNKRGKVL
jgi:hypothetical protein